MADQEQLPDAPEGDVDEEPIEGELVDETAPDPTQPVGTGLDDPMKPESGVEITEQHHSALEAAAMAAMAMPGMPGRDEFLMLAVQARMISLSAGAPKLVQGNPHLAFHVAMVGRDLGISVSAAIELIDVIDTQGGPRLSLSPQLINGQIRRLGLGAIIPIERTMTRCVARAVGPDMVTPLGPDTEFTWEEAQIAGLVGRNCQPGDHKPGSNGGKCGCNQGYKTYPRRMMWWRAAGFAADDYFPEAGLGLYSPEELGAFVDADGRAIDPSTVELPEGYEPAAIGSGKDAPPEIIDDETQASIKARIVALPDEAEAACKAQWKANGNLTAVSDLPVRMLKIADALVTSFEKRAEKGEWGPWEKPDPAAQPPDPGPGAPETPEPPDAPQPDPETVPDAPGPTQDPGPITEQDHVTAIVERVKGMTKLSCLAELESRSITPVVGNREAVQAQLAKVLIEESEAAF